MTKIAFMSPHCLVDFTNGAATATLDALKLLAVSGFACEAYCGTRLDDAHEGLVQESLFRRGIKYHVRAAKLGPYNGRLIFFIEGNLPVTLFENGSTRGGWFGEKEVKAFLKGCEIFLRKSRPDVVWTYGGDAVSIAVQRVAKSLGNYCRLCPSQLLLYKLRRLRGGGLPHRAERVFAGVLPRAARPRLPRAAECGRSGTGEVQGAGSGEHGAGRKPPSP